MADNAEAMQVMRDQAAYYNIKVDPMWTAEDLAQKILDAQIAVTNKANDDFAKAKKVKIKAVRDCWALEVRIPAGSTADIPVELARRFIEAGAAVQDIPLPEL